MGVSGDWVTENFYKKHNRAGRNASNPATDRLTAIERMHMKTFTEMAMNRFEWFNMPPSVDIRFLELLLFHNALAVFFEHETLGHLALRGSGVGPLNMYNNNTRFRVLGNRFVSRTLSAESTYVEGEIDGIPAMVEVPAKCVPIWANYLRTPDLDYALIYSHKLADIDRTIEINAHNSRYTKIVAASESQQLTTANVVRQIDEGSPAVFVNEVYDIENVTSFDLAIPPDVHLNIPILRTRIHADAMSLFGINNSNQDKKERLVADEVAANDDLVQTMRAINLNARQDACKRINEIFGLDVWVEYRTQLASDSVAVGSEEEEGEEDANDHDDTE